MWCSHNSSTDEDSGLVGHGVISVGQQLQTFRKSLLPPYSDAISQRTVITMTNVTVTKDIASAYFKIHCAASPCTYFFFVVAFQIHSCKLHATATLSDTSHLYGFLLAVRMTVRIQSSVERLRNRFRFSAVAFFCSAKCPERHCGQHSLLLIKWTASFPGDGEVGTC